MVRKIRQLNLLHVLFSILSTISQSSFINNFCTNTTIPGLNSEYHANLNAVFQYLIENATTSSGFHVAVSGSGENAVYGLFLCRGDQNATACRDCAVSATSALINTYCINYQQAFIWYDECMVRHTNESLFLGKMELRPATIMSADQNVSKSEIGQLEENLKDLFYDLPEEAAKTRSGRKFATKIVKFWGSSKKLYALAQCTPDLTVENCTLCLRSAIRHVPLGPSGGMLQPSCNLLYDSEPFFYGGDIDVAPPPPLVRQSNRTSPAAALTPRIPASRKRNVKLRIIVIGTVVPVLIVMALFLIISVCWYTRRRKTSKNVQKTEDQLSGISSLEFDLGTIKTATGNFSRDNKLGKGGFGVVYKGILPNGQEIAVKRLLGNSSNQGETEFKNEIMLLARLQHKNLVRLLGFCLEKEERLLIYEYVPNASLDRFLFDSTIHGCFDWDMRKKIIGGIIRGLLYLHEDSRLKIIHRDLKTNNILLDEGMNPKIADFGLAKLFSMDQTTANTSKIAGTYGYMAPEYARYGLVSVRSDIYSFGVLLLEIICGRKNRGFYGDENTAGLVSLVWRKWNEGAILSIIDPTIPLVNLMESEITRYVHIALLCVQENAAERPTMSSIVLMLSGQILPLPSPSIPGYVNAIPAMLPEQESSSSQSDNSKSNTISSVNPNSISDLLPR